jgi:hypothetical protein
MPEDLDGRCKAFSLAARAYQECAKGALGVDQWRIIYRDAAECFAHARMYKSAGQAFLAVLDYNDAARQFQHGGHYTQLLRLVQRHRLALNATWLPELIDDMRVHFLTSESEQKRRKADELFDNHEKKIQVCSVPVPCCTSTELTILISSSETVPN